MWFNCMGQLTVAAAAVSAAAEPAAAVVVVVLVAATLCTIYRLNQTTEPVINGA